MHLLPYALHPAHRPAPIRRPRFRWKFNSHTFSRMEPDASCYLLLGMIQVLHWKIVPDTLLSMHGVGTLRELYRGVRFSAAFVGSDRERLQPFRIVTRLIINPEGCPDRGNSRPGCCGSR